MDFFADIIKAKKNIGNIVDIKDSMNIAFAVDAQFAFGMGVLMTSIIKNNPSEKIAFHIFADSLRSEDINRLAVLGREHKNIAVYIYMINNERFKDFDTCFTWSKAIYYRFIICRELAEKAQRCLYLDADMLCLKPLTSLFTDNFAGNIVMAAADFPVMVDYAKNNIDFKGNKYFNAGMLMMDIAKWNEVKISERSIEMLSTENNLKYNDQDALNLLLTDKVKFLPQAYNTVYHLADMKENIAPDTIFLHYSGSVKPWQSWGQFHFLTPLWLKYQRLSPWKNAAIEEPVTYKQAKFMARTMYRTGKYTGWIKWLALYGFWKLRTKI